MVQCAETAVLLWCYTGIRLPRKWMMFIACCRNGRGTADNIWSGCVKTDIFFLVGQNRRLQRISSHPSLPLSTNICSIWRCYWSMAVRLRHKHNESWYGAFFASRMCFGMTWDKHWRQWIINWFHISCYQYYPRFASHSKSVFNQLSCWKY